MKIQPCCCLLHVFYLKILFIYLKGRQPEREGTQAGGVGGGVEEAGSQQKRETNEGLDPRSLGYCPELKADT